MVNFWIELPIRLTACFLQLFVLCLFVILVVSHFGFDCRTLGLIATVFGHCLLFTLILSLHKMSPVMFR